MEKLFTELWAIQHKETGLFIFEYKTYQGNIKKALFNSVRYAEQALNKYIKNPEEYRIVRV